MIINITSFTPLHCRYAIHVLTSEPPVPGCLSCTLSSQITSNILSRSLRWGFRASIVIRLGVAVTNIEGYWMIFWRLVEHIQWISHRRLITNSLQVSLTSPTLKVTSWHHAWMATVGPLACLKINRLSVWVITTNEDGNSPLKKWLS